MMNFIFVPHHNVGGHFFTWSIYYLSGQTRALLNGVPSDLLDVDLADVTKHKNFHSVSLQSPAGLTEVQQAIEKYQDSELDQINFYIVGPRWNKKCIELFGKDASECTHEQREYVNLKCHEEDFQIVPWLQRNNYPVIVIDQSEHDFLHTFYNNRAPINYQGFEHKTSHELWKFFEDKFYVSTKDKFDTDIWDLREKLALISNVDFPKNYYGAIDTTLPHLYYTTDDVWNYMPNLVEEMLDFLKLKLDPVRFEKWLIIYNEWRRKHQPEFARNFNLIIDAILTGKYMSLKRYNLNFFHEVIIQRTLIHKHGLNLKNWKLDKFPLNTLDLHNLLEPSIHNPTY